MSAGRDESVPEIEEELERTRADLDETLDRLKERLDPAAHVRHAADELAQGVASFYGHQPGSAEARREMRRLLADNFLPLAMIAGGVAWLVINEVRRSRRTEVYDYPGGYPEAAYAGATDFDEGPGPSPYGDGRAAGVADDPLATDPLAADPLATDPLAPEPRADRRPSDPLAADPLAETPAAGSRTADPLGGGTPRR